MDDLSLPVSMGTTIMAASFDGGVVMGADSRTSTGACEHPPPAAAATRSPRLPLRAGPVTPVPHSPPCGPADIANRVTDKITSLTDSIYICRSGSAADTQNLSRYVEVRRWGAGAQCCNSLQQQTELSNRQPG